jgi:predicted nucleic acid-binding protein
VAAAVNAALLDTSRLIASLDDTAPALPERAAISVITIGELRAGVLLAREPDQRAKRQARLAQVRSAFAALPVDDQVADRYAEALATARREGRTTKATDLLILATAAATGRELHTLDHAQAALAAALGLAVVAP